MTDCAIRVENLGKRYQLGQSQRYRALRDTLGDLLSAPKRWLRGDKRERPAGDDGTFWALKDVSFEIKPGEVVGIIGRNGAGKSTLLKILSRITEPTEGGIDLYGRVGSLLEVGTGFHPELTGRENIYLNGAILGMKRAEIARKFDEIVAFAEVERFLDTPVKFYSSGMYMRLAFAVAAHLEPEILLVDEVLAVGDAGFQKKCLGKMGEVAKQGRTVLFVSHNMAAVQKLCPRCLVVEQGKVALDGPSSEAIHQHLASDPTETGQFNLKRRQVKATRVEVINGWLEVNGAPTGSLLFGDSARLVLDVTVHEATTFGVELLLRQRDGLPVAFAPSGLMNDWEIDGQVGRLRIACDLPAAHYACGPYSIDVILAFSGAAFLDYLESAITFEVEGAAIGNRNWRFTQAGGQGHQLWDVRYRRIATTESPC